MSSKLRAGWALRRKLIERSCGSAGGESRARKWPEREVCPLEGATHVTCELQESALNMQAWMELATRFSTHLLLQALEFLETRLLCKGFSQSIHLIVLLAIHVIERFPCFPVIKPCQEHQYLTKVLY